MSSKTALFWCENYFSFLFQKHLTFESKREIIRLERRIKMTKKQVAQWANEHNLDPEAVIDQVRREVAAAGTSWQSVELLASSKKGSKFVRSGYRKLTTDEYVPQAYRANFGWKNTYYQAAKLTIYVVVQPEECEKC